MTRWISAPRFEAYLEGGWYTFDAGHDEPRIARVVIARGRDAADVAMTHAFGAAYLRKFSLICEEVADELDVVGSNLIAAA